MSPHAARPIILALAVYFAGLVAAIAAVGRTLAPPAVRSLRRDLHASH